MPTAGGACPPARPAAGGRRPPARSAADRCPCPNAGECSQAWNESSSRQRVTTSQVVRSSVGLSSSNPSNPSWSSTAPARAAKRRASSSPLSAGTVIALILTTVMPTIMPGPCARTIRLGPRREAERPMLSVPATVKAPHRGDPALMIPAATLLGDRYQLDEPIGTGGYCEVWRATDAVLAPAGALKLLPPR